MNCWFSFKQVKHSEELIAQTQPRIVAKVEKFASKAIDAHVTFSKSGSAHYMARCTLKGGDGFNLHVEATEESLNTAVDAMLHRLETQLKRHKEKLKDHKHVHLPRLSLVPELKKDEWDAAEIEADDVIKYEQVSSSRRRVAQRQHR